MARIPTSDETGGDRLPPRGAQVADAGGRLAHVVSVQQAGPDATVTIRVEHGPELVLPAGLLALQNDSTYRLPFAFGALSDNTGNQQKTVIPVWQEELQIGKRVVDTGKGIRIHKTVSEQERTIDLPLLQDELAVEHVLIGQIIDPAQQPVVRYDGPTLVVPILEEVLVVEKQLRLKEEVRITRYQHEVSAPQTVSMKSEQVSIERFDERSESSRHSAVPQSSARTEPDPGKAAG